MDIISAAISGFSASVDKHAFDINVLVKDQSKEQSLDKLMVAIKNYNLARLNLQTAQELKSQLTNTQEQEFNES